MTGPPLSKEFLISLIKTNEQKALEELYKMDKEQQNEDDDDGTPSKVSALAGRLSKQLENKIIKMGGSLKLQSKTKQDKCIELMAKHRISWEEAEKLWKEKSGM